ALRQVGPRRFRNGRSASTQVPNGAQDLPTVPQRDAELIHVSIRQLGEDVDLDVVLDKAAASSANPSEPSHSAIGCIAVSPAFAPVPSAFWTPRALVPDSSETFLGWHAFIAATTQGRAQC